MSYSISPVKGNLPQIFMYPNLDTHAPAFGVLHICLETNAPSVTGQALSSLNDHVADQLTMVHQGGSQLLSAGPGLWTPAVEVNALDVGRNEGRCSSKLEGDVGSELHDGCRLVRLA